MDMIKLINKMAQQGEDFSSIVEIYNELIKEYNLPLTEIEWISSTEFTFIGDYTDTWED